MNDFPRRTIREWKQEYYRQRAARTERLLSWVIERVIVIEFLILIYLVLR